MQNAKEANFEFNENRRARQGYRSELTLQRVSAAASQAVQTKVLTLNLPPFENGFALFEKSGYAFLFVLGGKADREEIYLASEAFVEV